MSQPSDDTRPAANGGRIRGVLLDVLARRSRGEALPDEAVLAAHPELHDDLAERLRVLGMLERAERGSSTPEPGPGLAPPSGIGPDDWLTTALKGYHDLREVHRGGQGIVFHAVQTATRREVAIKLLPGGRFAGAADRARFEREVEILARLRHPNIVAIHECGVAAGSVWFVMDYVAGRPLDEHVAALMGRAAPGASGSSSVGPPTAGAGDGARVRRRRWSFLRRSAAPGGRGAPGLADTLALFVKLCDAVNAAHLQGVMHRDLKPGNILVDPAGEPFVLDFGLARFVGGAEPGPPGAALTEAGQFVGTLPWASPEQLAGDPARVDLRSDVYSLGVLLYQSLTGRLPHVPREPQHDFARRIATQPAARPSRLCAASNAELDAIVLRCLDPDPRRRYQSAGELARDLQRFLRGEAVEARAEVRWYALRKTLARHRLAASSVAALLVALVLATGVLAWARTRQSRMLAALTAAAQAEARARRGADQLNGVLQDVLDAVAQAGRGAETGLRRGLLDAAARDVERRLADDPQSLAAACDALGRTYQRLALYDEAERHLRNALALRARHCGSDSPAAADSLHNLAALLMDRHRFAEAEPLLSRALEIRRSACGPSHVDVARTLDQLGLILQGRQRFDEAEGLHRQALEIFLGAGEAARPDVALCLTRIGLALCNRQEYDAAEPPLQQALEVYRERFGDEHVDVAGGLVNLAKLLTARGEPARAEPLLCRAVAIYRRLLGDQHDNVAWALHRWGDALRALGRFDEAADAMRDALGIYERLFGPDDVYVAFVLESLACLALDCGDHAAAAAALQRAWAIRRVRFPEDRVHLAATASTLGECLTALGDRDQAAGVLAEALDLLREERGADDPRTLATVQRIERLLAGDASAEATLPPTPPFDQPP